MTAKRFAVRPLEEEKREGQGFGADWRAIHEAMHPGRACKPVNCDCFCTCTREMGCDAFGPLCSTCTVGAGRDETEEGLPIHATRETVERIFQQRSERGLHHV